MGVLQVVVTVEIHTEYQEGRKEVKEETSLNLPGKNREKKDWPVMIHAVLKNFYL